MRKWKWWRASELAIQECNSSNIQFHYICLGGMISPCPNAQETVKSVANPTKEARHMKNLNFHFEEGLILSLTLHRSRNYRSAIKLIHYDRYEEKI